MPNRIHGEHPLEVKGDHVLITGVCGDIGLGIANAFLDQGMRVTLVDLNIAPGETLAAERERVSLVELDLADADAVAARLTPLAQSPDAPDVLINGVGWTPKKSPEGKPWTTWEMPVEHFSRVVAVNLTAVFQCTGIFIPAMLARGHGRIINIASLAARIGGTVAPVHYVSGKAGVLGLTKVVARELGGTGLTINAINPGRIDTRMIKDVPEGVNQAIAARIPVGRLGLPADVAKVCLFLASDLADYLTGTTIEVNGGLYVGP
ncbi:MAG: SDR family oxidoreductase [Boseongicola sp. SB0673_bin_14]|nr:SDR family oxidoreductase [Boseongicola sp. SB0667_bin_21]MYI70520.1 SDR family oxidoreductase [Boseongicola sp. SB0673_bin_14]